MLKYSRYKPVGWRGESHRHYLAAKGLSSKNRYFVRDELKGNRGFPALHSAFAKGHTVPDLEVDEGIRQRFGVSLGDIQAFKAQGKRSRLPEGLSVAEGDIPQQAVPVIPEPELQEPATVSELPPVAEPDVPEPELSPESSEVDAPGNVISTQGVPERAPLQFSTGFQL